MSALRREHRAASVVLLSLGVCLQSLTGCGAGPDAPASAPRDSARESSTAPFAGSRSEVEATAEGEGSPPSVLGTAGRAEASSQPPTDSLGTSREIEDTAVLASVTTDDGRTLTFRETRDGLAVSETGAVTQRPLFRGSDIRSVTELYRLITGGREPPEALLEAEQRVRSASGSPPSPQRASVPKPPAAIEAAASRHDAKATAALRPESTGLQQWFTQTFCQGADVADTVLNPTEGQSLSWTFANNYDVYAFSDPSSGAVETLWGWTLEYYNGTWQWTQSWKSGAIAPGHYWHEYQWTTNNVWRYAQLWGGSAGPNAMCEWERDNAISYAIWSGGRVYFAGSYPNDSSVDIWLGGISLGAISTSAGNFSASWAPSCKGSGVTNSSYELVVNGAQTGQSATYPVTLTGCW